MQLQQELVLIAEADSRTSQGDHTYVGGFDIDGAVLGGSDADDTVAATLVCLTGSGINEIGGQIGGIFDNLCLSCG